MDACSSRAYEMLEKSGHIGHDQRIVLDAFERIGGTATTRQIAELCLGRVDHNGVRSRITELTGAGVLEKLVLTPSEKPICPETGKRVNQWRIVQGHVGPRIASRQSEPPEDLFQPQGSR